MKHLIILFSIIISSASVAQKRINYTPDSIDSRYGITRYQPYIEAVGGKEKRKCDGLPCNAYVTDLYQNGSILHKGYYQYGILTNFKNYYPNGTVERDFKSVDVNRASMKQYYSDGTLRSSAKYVNQEPVFWEDYYPNGELEYKEEYDRDFTYYKYQGAFDSLGNPEFEMELEKKNRRLYSRVEYHPNGVIKASGPVVFHENLAKYVRAGWWTYYNEKGEAYLKKEYVNDEVVTEEEL